MDAWALTDHGHANGFAHAHLHSKKINGSGQKFKFIGGVEAYYHPDLKAWAEDYEIAKQARLDAKALKKSKLADDKELSTGGSEEESMTIENEDATKDVSKWFNPVNRRHHLVLLPKSRKGLENIFTLVSRSYKEGFFKFPRIDRKMLKEHGEDIIALTACVHPDAILITDQGKLTIKDVVEKFKAGESLQTLSYDEQQKKPVFKPITWGEMTRKQAKLLCIKLKNGKSVRITPDHKVFTQRGWIEAQFLVKTDKILSFTSNT